MNKDSQPASVCTYKLTTLLLKLNFLQGAYRDVVLWLNPDAKLNKTQARSVGKNGLGLPTVYVIPSS
ncbi:hypothetical protein PIIN_09016 [Serendipita indica DSM 11827]|uniref:Uncharacterized protein n=1 Tax=Serendipita indica (strain DSM 11827) TaxID=1109443 RepID=G4TUN8_SERID|nr:hypothetical protein PIIN_09016 [Serendipita indica DSM 11827]